MYDADKVNAKALRVEMFYCGVIAKERGTALLLYEKIAMPPFGIWRPIRSE